MDDLRIFIAHGARGAVDGYGTKPSDLLLAYGSRDTWTHGRGLDVAVESCVQ